MNNRRPLFGWDAGLPALVHDRPFAASITSMREFTTSDRLFLLSTYRLTLRHNQFTSAESVLQANGPRLAELHIHRAAIVQLVRQSDPDVMRALFLPRGPIDWSVAGSAHDVNLRLLSVTRRLGRYSVDVLRRAFLSAIQAARSWLPSSSTR